MWDVGAPHGNKDSAFDNHFDKEDIFHRFEQAARAIQWKAHQQSLVNQEAAGTDLIKCVDDNDVFLVEG